MRIRRQADAPFSFGIRALLGLVAFFASLMWCGPFAWVLIAVACVAAHYCVLCIVSIASVRLGGATDTPRYRNWQFTTPDDGAALRVIVMTYLIFHYVWHFFWVLVILPTGFPVIWHTPSLGPLTLAQVDHFCLAGFSLLLMTSFAFRAYAGSRFSRRICIVASTLLALLNASHFAVAP